MPCGDGYLPLGCSQTQLDDDLSGEAHGFDPPLHRAYRVEPDRIWRARLNASADPPDAEPDNEERK